MKMSWNYKQPHEPQSDEVAKENNGYALEDLYDANGVLIAKKGQLLSSFAHLRDDGTTASSCWIYTGSWTEQGNQMANRDNSDPSGLGIRWDGHRRGRSTVAYSTTVLRRISTVNRGSETDADPVER